MNLSLSRFSLFVFFTIFSCGYLNAAEYYPIIIVKKRKNSNLEHIQQMEASRVILHAIEIYPQLRDFIPIPAAARIFVPQDVEEPQVNEQSNDDESIEPQRNVRRRLFEDDAEAAPAATRQISYNIDIHTYANHDALNFAQYEEIGSFELLDLLKHLRMLEQRHNINNSRINTIVLPSQNILTNAVIDFIAINMPNITNLYIANGNELLLTRLERLIRAYRPNLMLSFLPLNFDENVDQMIFVKQNNVVFFLP